MGALEDLYAQAVSPSPPASSSSTQFALLQSIMAQQQQKQKQAGGGKGPGGGVGGGGAPKSGDAARLINIAHRQIGDPYVWGDTGPAGFDCSGLVDFSLKKVGVHVPGRLTANGLQNWTHPVSKHQLDPGDLVFFNYGRLGPGQADHVGIYKGHGKMIAASSSAGHVQVQPVDWSNFIGGGVIPHL